MRNLLIRIWSWICGLVTTSLVLFVFGYILWRGSQVLSWSFLFDYPAGTPLGTAGGIFPAIMGSLYVGGFSAFFASLCALSVAIYLVFYCQSYLLKEILRFIVQCTSGIPSIVLGLFGYSFFLMYAGLPRSVLSASLTLAIMILPFITLRLEKIFREIPREIIDSSLALGTSLEYTIFMIILPHRLGEIASSIALAAAYAMGAVAPIMYTGTVLYFGHIPDLTDPFMSLPYHLYVLVNEGYSMTMAYGTAFVLLVLLLIINILCRSLQKGN